MCGQTIDPFEPTVVDDVAEDTRKHLRCAVTIEPYISVTPEETGRKRLDVDTLKKVVETFVTEADLQTVSSLFPSTGISRFLGSR